MTENLPNVPFEPLKVMVTGGSGFLGAFVIRALCETGYIVRCLIRAGSDTSRIEGLPIEKHVGNVLDPESVKKCMEGCHVCIHLAISSSGDNKRTPAQIKESVSVSQLGTLHVLEAAKDQGNTRVVYVSSIAAINCSTDPHNIFTEETPPEATGEALAYVQMKRAGEELVLSYAKEGVPTIILNPAEIYGPFDTQLVSACNLVKFLTHWPLVLPSTGGTAIVAAEDVANAVVAACTRGRLGERYILAGPNLSVRELAAFTLKVAGNLAFEDLSNRWIMEVPSHQLKAVVNTLDSWFLPTPIDPGVLDFAVLYWYMDSGKAKRELGFESRSVEDILRPAIYWLMQTGHLPSLTD